MGQINPCRGWSEDFFIIKVVLGGYQHSPRPQSNSKAPQRARSNHPSALPSSPLEQCSVADFDLGWDFAGVYWRIMTSRSRGITRVLSRRQRLDEMDNVAQRTRQNRIDNDRELLFFRPTSICEMHREWCGCEPSSISFG